jgi:hypothetical protein
MKRSYWKIERLDKGAACREDGRTDLKAKTSTLLMNIIVVMMK